MTARDLHDGADNCGHCRHFRKVRQPLDGMDELWGACRNLRSDHCGHVLGWGHPMCGQGELLRKERT